MASQIKNLTFHNLVDSCLTDDTNKSDKLNLGDLDHNIDKYFEFTALQPLDLQKSYSLEENIHMRDSLCLSPQQIYTLNPMDYHINQSAISTPLTNSEEQEDCYTFQTMNFINSKEANYEPQSTSIQTSLSINNAKELHQSSERDQIQPFSKNLRLRNKQIQEKSVEDQITNSDNDKSYIELRKRYKKRTGRPFIGEVLDKKGREDHVILRRSIFRQVKNLFSRADYVEVLGESFTKALRHLAKEAKIQVQRVIELMQKCQVRMSQKRKSCEQNNDVFLIFDPCYRYSRLAKERFFRNVYCSFLFVIASRYLKEASSSEKDEKLRIKLICDLEKMAKRQILKQNPNLLKNLNLGSD